MHSSHKVLGEIRGNNVNSLHECVIMFPGHSKLPVYCYLNALSALTYFLLLFVTSEALKHNNIAGKRGASNVHIIIS